MPSTELIEVSIGRKEHLPNGIEVYATRQARKNSHINPSGRSLHESTHAVLSGSDLIDTSIVPGPGYNGITRTSRYNPIAAMGPHSLGMSGTSHDFNMVERTSGHAQAYEGPARNESNEKEEEIFAVAQNLEVSKTLTKRDVDETMKEIKLGEIVRVELKTPEGEKQIIEKRVKSTEHVFMLEDVKFTLPQPPL